jgi:hypothetical protein
MPRVLFLVNLREHGSYICHARVTFASARELQEFLTRNTAQEKDGWRVLITRGPARGYDGKPLHHADIRLYVGCIRVAVYRHALPETTDFTVTDGESLADYGREEESHRNEKRTPHLERAEHASAGEQALLLQLGVTDLGWWR